MEKSSRSSSESSHDSETPFLKDFEKLNGSTKYIRVRRRLNLALVVPWVLCVVLLIGNVLLGLRIDGAIGGPSIGYWTELELGMSSFNSILILTSNG